MIIPENVSYIQFYRLASAKGIKIRSRYKGVHFAINTVSKRINWAAKCMINGKSHFLGNFIFSADGEKQAHDAYLRFLGGNNILKSTIKNKKKCKANLNNGSK